MMNHIHWGNLKTAGLDVAQCGNVHSKFSLGIAETLLAKAEFPQPKIHVLAEEYSQMPKLAPGS